MAETRAQPEPSVFADDALVMIRPFSSYPPIAAALAATRELRRPRQNFWLLIRRPLLFLLIVGAFVSFTTAGRLIVVHVMSAMIAWAFIPIYEVFWLTLVTRLFVRDRSLRRPLPELVDLYFIGQGPWLFFMMAISAICIFAPEVWPTFSWMLEYGVLLGLLVISILWGAAVTLGFFRGGLGLRWPLAVGAMLTYYVLLDGTVTAYYVFSGQLIPLLFGVAR